MSAYLCGNRHQNAVAEILAVCLAVMTGGEQLWEKPPEEGVVKGLLPRLHGVNRESVGHRYSNDPDMTDWYPGPWREDSGILGESIHDWLNVMRCWRYQSCESDDTEASLEYRTVEAAITLIEASGGRAEDSTIWDYGHTHDEPVRRLRGVG